MNRRTLLLVSAALVVVTGAVVVPLTGGPGQSPAREVGVSPAPAAEPIPGTAAMRAYLNPETGKLEVGVPPAGSFAASALDPETQNALRRDGEGLVEMHHPNGAVSVHLQGRFQSVSVLRMDEEGNAVVCTDNAHGVRQVLQGQRTPEVK